jgi:hypothetical protein
MKVTLGFLGLWLGLLQFPANGQGLLERMTGGDDGYYDDGGDYYDDGYSDDGYYDDGYYYDDHHHHNDYQGGYNQGGYNQWRQPLSYQPRRPAVVYSQLPITISMPDGEAGLCAYILGDGSNAWNYSIAPGKSQSFKEDRAWTVRYDRGNGYGEQMYRLKPGHYKFRQSARGWELYYSAPGGNAPLNAGPPAPM